MELEKLFNQKFLYDLSFFNFENAITATYFADADLNIIKVNKNFRSLFNNDVTLEGQKHEIRQNKGHFYYLTS